MLPYVLVDLLWSRHLDLQLRDLVSRAGLTHAQLWLSGTTQAIVVDHGSYDDC